MRVLHVRCGESATMQNWNSGSWKKLQPNKEPTGKGIRWSKSVQEQQRNVPRCYNVQLFLWLWNFLDLWKGIPEARDFMLKGMQYVHNEMSEGCLLTRSILMGERVKRKPTNIRMMTHEIWKNAKIGLRIKISTAWVEYSAAAQWAFLSMNLASLTLRLSASGAFLARSTTGQRRPNSLMALYFKGIRLRPSETENRACDVNSEQNFQPLH